MLQEKSQYEGKRGILVFETEYHQQPPKKCNLVRPGNVCSCMILGCQIEENGHFHQLHLESSWVYKWRKKQLFRASCLDNTCLGFVCKVLLRRWYPTWWYKSPPSPPPPSTPSVHWSFIVDLFFWDLLDYKVLTHFLLKTCKPVANLRVSSVSSCWQGPLEYCSPGPHEINQGPTKYARK